MKVLIIGENNSNSLETIYKKNFINLNCKLVKIIPLLKPKNFLFKKILNFNEKYLYFIYCLIQNYLLIKKIKKEKNVFDLIIIFNGYFLSKNSIIKIKSKSRQSFINIQTDNIFQKKNILKKNLRYFDKIYVWSKYLQKEIFQKLRIKKKKILYLPFAFDQFLSRKKNIKKINNNILFYGSWDKVREKQLKKINSKNLIIFGNGWEKADKNFKKKYKIKKEIVGKKLSLEISKSLVCLNIFRAQAKNLINMRSFEVIGYGGSLLSEYSSEQYYFFKNYSNINYFRDIKDINNIYKKILVKKNKLLKYREINLKKIKYHDYFNRAKFILNNEKIYLNK